MEGRRLIFWLFVLLAAATALVMVVYMQTPVAATVRKRLALATAGNLSAPVAAWFILRAIAERGNRLRLALSGLAATLSTYAVALLMLLALGLVRLA